MTMYNLLFGQNNKCDELLKLINITKEYIPRLRDCYENDTHIIIYTRTGGGNRPSYELNKEKYPYEYGIDARPNIDIDNVNIEELYGFNDYLRRNKYYVGDEDDDFDSTYAYFYFKKP